MKFRKLGQSDLNMSVITLGTWGMGGDFWGKVDDEQSIATIQAALDAGITTIDTAPAYGRGHSEELIGKAIKGRRREDIILATKVGIDIHHNKEHICTPETIAQEIEESLQRLGTDYIDLYQVHWPDDKVPFEETFGELETMRKQGKIRYIGVSNFSVEQTEEASKYCQIVSTQPQYSLLVREIEKELLPYCVEKNIGILSYGSIGAGALTGKFKEKPVFKEDDERASFYTFFQEQNWPRTKKMIDTLEEIASGHGKPTVHAAINWVLKQKGITVALVGARTPEQVRMNAQAAEWELTDEENAKIEAAYAKIFE